ncbi:UNKNOWN [Stylonychia lemnae]|uniref:Uncharacterized protein n=1 Tax=Stylonychia lemnae TaxID=5949 RepID=A0A078B5C0_STYLE|nr:UNKNOWN [Stylonychia lemnae]|eukprot:CDW89624.1 UNKNOWN [Stylonychia lemnae]
MKTQRDYQQRPDKQLNLHQESPHVLKERPNSGSDFNHISPIQSIPVTSSAALLAHTANEKTLYTKQQQLMQHPHQHLQHNQDPKLLSNNQRQMQHQQYAQQYQYSSGPGGYQKYESNDISPLGNNNLVQEFYKKPQQIDDLGDDFYSDDNDLEGEASMDYNSIAGRQDYPQNIGINMYGAPSNITAYSQSTGNQNKQGTNKQNQRDLKQATCTEFDLTAKEINSNKRFDKQKKNTIISGRTSHSPIDGQPSNSETVKWAFSNKDSQETQKKISIINRESINVQDMISRSLKSHDSKGAQSSQQTTSTKNIPNSIKGKMLDFVNLDQQPHQQIESGLFYSTSQNKLVANTNDSNYLRNDEEEKMISFLEGETELLMSSNKKIIGNMNIAGIQYKKYASHLNSNLSNNGKYMVNHQEKMPDFFQSYINRVKECLLCHEQKIHDSSHNCSVLDPPKSLSQIVIQNLNKKYLTSREYYASKVINDIIYNEQIHIVSVFKDYLIFDDISEFLKRFYFRQESFQRLPKMFEFYEKYSKVFPNYVTLPENKYLFKNIEKKQKNFDEKQRIIQEQIEKKLRDQQNGFQLGSSAEKANKSKHRDRFSSQQMANSSMNSYMSTNRMFDTKFIDSVANIQASGIIEASSLQSSRINNSQYQEHVLNSSILVHQHLQQNMENAQKKKKKALHDLDFGELISKFIAKDSQQTLQQSSIYPDLQTSEKKQPLNENNQNISNRPQSNLAQQQQQLQKKPQIYEYQEKKIAQQNQVQINTENSKTISDGVSSGRPTSSKSKIEIKTKSQSTGIANQLNSQQIQQQQINQVQPGKISINHQVAQEKQTQQHLQQQQPHQQTYDVNKEGGQIINYALNTNPNQQVPNHLIINNFMQDKNQLQKQCDIIINIASSNIITSQNLPPQDRNFYDYNMYQSNNNNPNANYNQYPNNYALMNQNPDQQQYKVPTPNDHIQEVKVLASGNGSRQGSLQRSQSRSNLHNAQQLQQMSQKVISDNNTNCQTPMRNNIQREMKTPGSGNTQNDNKIQPNMVQNKILKRVKNQNKQNVQQQYMQDQQQNLMSLSGNNKSLSTLQKSDKDHTHSPLNIYAQRNPVFTVSLNQPKSNTEVVASRELSKERRQTINAVPSTQKMQNNIIYQSQQQQMQMMPSTSNQMFKNEMIMNLTAKQTESKVIQLDRQFKNHMPEYSSAGSQSGHMGSIERLRSIEDEISKDYSKYVNEYGLGKTAFAKAVNSIREKQVLQHQNTLKQQQIGSQPTSTRQGRLVQNSNEKKRTTSNNPRSGSTSQQRKCSNSRQQNYKNALQAQESINELYHNTNKNDQKQIRSVRAKTHLNSQNSSSCYQRSSKLSPDKNIISAAHITNQNILGLTQTINGQFNPNQSSNYITLKAKPQNQSKGIKIKFPINSSRGNSKQQNQSQNQTPKRVKLQKTKSTSNIPICFTSRVGLNNQSNVLLTQRNRINGQDMVIMDEMSYQMNATNPSLNYNCMNNGNQNENGGGIMNFNQNTFNTNSCLGTYTTTSILNSPLSFKNQAGFISQAQLQQQQQQQQLQQQQQQQQLSTQQQTRNNSKGRQSSRNGANSQHQSQKSINNGHQRASSNNGVLQNSNNKNKKAQVVTSGDPKRLSGGSTLSKKQSQVHHQASSSIMTQQILQLLMSHQTQQDGDALGTSSIQQNIAQNSTLKLLQSNNSQSMKDLKSMKQQQPTTSTLLKDMNIIKAPKQSINNQGGFILQSQPSSSTANTQRQGGQSILMVNNQNSRKTKGSGKLTSRGGDSSRKRVLQQQNIVVPSNVDCTTSISTNNQYSNTGGMANMTSNDLSSRIQNSLAMNYADQTSSVQMDNKRVLSQSKSQENFDLIRGNILYLQFNLVAAQRAALEQQQTSQQLQQQQFMNSQQLNSTSNKFLQNLKQQENQISLQKIKLMPPQTFQQMPVQSARNLQFDNNVNYRSNNMQDNTSDQQLYQQQQQQVQYSKGATNIIIGQNFEKPSSRRTSGKFNPQSTRSNNQQMQQQQQ